MENHFKDMIKMSRIIEKKKKKPSQKECKNASIYAKRRIRARSANNKCSQIHSLFKEGNKFLTALTKSIYLILYHIFSNKYRCYGEIR